MNVIDIADLARNIRFVLVLVLVLITRMYWICIWMQNIVLKWLLERKFPSLSCFAYLVLTYTSHRNLIPHLSLDEVLAYHNSYLNLPNLESIERQIEERKLYYVQEDNQ